MHRGQRFFFLGGGVGDVGDAPSDSEVPSDASPDVGRGAGRAVIPDDLGLGRGAGGDAEPLSFGAGFGAGLPLLAACACAFLAAGGSTGALGSELPALGSGLPFASSSASLAASCL